MSTVRSKLETAMRLLEEVQQVLSLHESEPPSDNSSEEDTKLVSEEIRTNSEEVRTDYEETTKNTTTRSERQVAAYKANFERRWDGTKSKEESTKHTSVYDQL